MIRLQLRPDDKATARCSDAVRLSHLSTEQSHYYDMPQAGVAAAIGLRKMSGI